MSQLIQRAEEAFKKRNYDYAIELYLQHLEAYPDDVDARKSLRVSEIKKFQDQGSTGGGFAAYLKGLIPFVTAWFKVNLKKFDGALTACEQFLKHAPRNVLVLGWLGKAARGAGYLETAISTWEDVLSLDQENEAALRALARCHKERGEVEEATSYYERLQKVLPNDPEAAKAIRDLAATSSYERSQSARMEAGGSFRGMIKDKDEAQKLEKDQHIIRSADEALEVAEAIRAELDENPEDQRLWQKLGDTLVKAHEFEEAVEAYEQGLEHAPDDTVLKDKIGDARVKKFDRRIKKAKKAGDKAALKEARREKAAYCIEEWGRRVEEAPTELSLRYKYGTYLYRGKKFDEAIAEFQEAVNDPRYREKATVMLGKSFASKGMTGQAIKMFERARSDSDTMDKTAKELTYNLGVLYARDGEVEKGIAELEKIIEVDINYRDTMKRIEKLKQKVG